MINLIDAACTKCGETPCENVDEFARPFCSEGCAQDKNHYPHQHTWVHIAGGFATDGKTFLPDYKTCTLCDAEVSIT